MMSSIRISIAAKHIEYVKLGFFVPVDYRGDGTRMSYGAIGFGESPERECVISNPSLNRTYDVNLPAVASPWVPQMELRVKVEGKDMYMKFLYLDDIDWSKSPAFTIVVTKDKERTHVLL